MPHLEVQEQKIRRLIVQGVQCLNPLRGRDGFTESQESKQARRGGYLPVDENGNLR
tara:strand:+ start:185 stop:352 length:168 start_codon:yes stop_codon:yes gene_type:complete